MSVEGERWLLIAASSRGTAEAYAARRGIDVALILDRRDLLTPPWRLRARIAAAGVDRAAIHSVDWQRERAPQLSELALGLAPLGVRELIDEASATVESRGDFLAAGTAARLPFEVARAGAAAGLQVSRLLRGTPSRPVDSSRLGEPTAVLAVWPGSSNGVGGAVTHMSGILSGFKRVGLRVSLVGPGPVPKQLADCVDDIEVATPLDRSTRLTRDTEQVAVNRVLDEAAERLLRRSPVDFVYQRHSAYLVAGARLSARLAIPLVLEWNASEAWMRRNWGRPPRWAPSMGDVIAALERRVLGASALIAAVSSGAAAMATDAGADPERVRVVPNGVDVAGLDAALARSTSSASEDGDVIGWIGSFGPWHGAPTLVRSMTRLPSHVRLRMIGDGLERPAVQALARELGVADRIEWLGTLSHDDALVSLSQCDILASPHVPASDSPFFGSPTKIFEYMALGKPIVASRLEQIGEVLDDDRTALLVEPGDERALADAIERILDRPDRGAELGRAAAAEARELHTWDRRATDLLGALSESS